MRCAFGSTLPFFVTSVICHKPRKSGAPATSGSVHPCRMGLGKVLPYPPRGVCATGMSSTCNIPADKELFFSDNMLASRNKHNDYICNPPSGGAPKGCAVDNCYAHCLFQVLLRSTNSLIAEATWAGCSILSKWPASLIHLSSTHGHSVAALSKRNAGWS